MANHSVVDLVGAIDDTYARKGAGAVPPGGDAGEVLRKKSSTDGDTEWAEPMYHFDTIAEMNAALANDEVPDGVYMTVEENSPSGDIGDTALSTTSTNWVQNKVVTLKINGVSSTLAYVNTGTTADQAYAEGDYILMYTANVLYKATTAIAAGASFNTASGGNVEQTTIGAALKDIAANAGAHTLSDLTDTTISSPSDAQPLTYNNTSSKWVNGGIIPTANGGTGNADGYIRTGQRSGTTIGTRATAEGENNTASGHCSHAEGDTTQATGLRSHTEGLYTQARGNQSHAGGYETVAGYDFQTVIGKDNANYEDSLFEIGNGTSANARSNAIAVKNDGRIHKGSDDAFPAASNLAPVEDTMAASAQNPHRNSYAPGAYVYVKETDKLYRNKLSSTIGVNDSLTGNVDEVNVGEVLTSLSSDIASHFVDGGTYTGTSGTPVNKTLTLGQGVWLFITVNGDGNRTGMWYVTSDTTDSTFRLTNVINNNISGYFDVTSGSAYSLVCVIKSTFSLKAVKLG